MVDAKCKKNQLSIGKAGEAVLNTMMTIVIENFEKGRSQAPVMFFAESMIHDITNAQFRMPFEDNASIMEELHRKYGIEGGE